MKICNRCGSSLQDDAVYCSVCGSPQDNNIMMEQQFAERYQPMPNNNEPKKKSPSSIFVVLLLFIAAVAGYKYLFGNDTVLNGMKESEIDDYGYYENNETTITGKKVKYTDFSFTIPDSVVANVTSDGLTLRSVVKGYAAIIQKKDGLVSNAEKNQKNFVQEISEKNITVDKFENRKINEKNFLVIEATMPERQYYLLVTQATKDYTFIVTIITDSSQLSESALNDVATIITSAKLN